jgi:hypothetical protein
MLVAADAAGICRVAVQLHDVVSGEAGRLMQIVDVLGDDGRNFAGLVERRQRTVAATWSCGGKGRLHVEPPPPPLNARILTRNELIVGDRPVAAPQPSRRTEVGDAALGRNSCTREGNNDICRRNHVAELLDAATEVCCDHPEYPRLV